MGSRLKGQFDVVLYSPAEELERQAWADRVLRTLERLAVLTGNRPFTGFRGEQQVTVDLTRSAIEAQIEANVNREGGQVFTELGSIFGVGITSHHGDAEVDDVIASFRVGNTEPRFHNGVTVVFLGLRRIPTRTRMRGWTRTRWPAQRLHWYTYFGPDRLRGLDFAALERDPQIAVGRHSDGSVEVMLGEHWQSAERLLEAQRRLEPLFFRTAPGPTGRR